MPEKKFVGCFWRPLEAPKIYLLIKVWWVLKNWGNSLFDGHWDIWIWTIVSWDNWVQRGLGSMITFWVQENLSKLGRSVQTQFSLPFFVIITKFQCWLESWWQEDSKTLPTLEYYFKVEVPEPSKTKPNFDERWNNLWMKFSAICHDFSVQKKKFKIFKCKFLCSQLTNLENL